MNRSMLSPSLPNQACFSPSPSGASCQRRISRTTLPRRMQQMHRSQSVRPSLFPMRRKTPANANSTPRTSVTVGPMEKSSIWKHGH